MAGAGCCTAKSHVWRGRLFQMPGLHGPFKNFIRTKGRKCNPPNGYHGVYALDGEMCYTTQGMELIRLSEVSRGAKMSGIFYIRPVSIGLDSQVWPFLFMF